MANSITIKGVVFSNLVDTPEKAADLKTSYAKNTGKAYDLDGAIAAGDDFFKRNSDHIRGALRLLKNGK